MYYLAQRSGGIIALIQVIHSQICILTGGAVLLGPPRVEEAGAVHDDGVALVAVVVGDAVVALARPLRALALLAPGQHLHLGVGAALDTGVKV